MVGTFDTGAFEVETSSERIFRLTPDLEVVAREGSRASKALDEVFGAMDAGDHQPAREATRLLELDVGRTQSRALVLTINDLAVARIAGERAVAPAIEGTLCGFAVRSRRDAAALHAATVELDGKGILLLGSKGSGKSTLSALLAQEGAKYFGDEIAFVRHSDLVIEAFPKSVSVKEGSFPLFPETETHFDPIRGAIRYQRPPLIGEETHPRLIILPRYDAKLQECRITELEPGETALELVKQTFGGLDRHPVTINVIAELAAVPAFVVEYPAGRAAVAAVAELAGIIE